MTLWASLDRRPSGQAKSLRSFFPQSEEVAMIRWLYCNACQCYRVHTLRKCLTVFLATCTCGHSRTCESPDS